MGLRRAVSAPRGSTSRSPRHRASQATRATCRSCSAPARCSTPRHCARSIFFLRGAAQYLERFTQALDQALDSGFILPADRSEILELAAATFGTSEAVES